LIKLPLSKVLGSQYQLFAQPQSGPAQWDRPHL